MNKGKQLSIAIPTYNRPEWTIRAFRQVHDDVRVKEIIIVDDCSHPNNCSILTNLAFEYPKSKIIYEPKNVGVYKNKMRAVKHCTSDYVILFDSDNILTTEYIDAVYKQEWRPDTILAPEFAKPHFDYRRFTGQTINRTNAKHFAFKPTFDCLANTMNFFVNREYFLAVWEAKDDIKGADSIYFFYRWLAAGFNVYITPEMQYEHTVHDGSYYQSVAHESGDVCKYYEKLISQLR